MSAHNLFALSLSLAPLLPLSLPNPNPNATNTEGLGLEKFMRVLPHDLVEPPPRRETSLPVSCKSVSVTPVAGEDGVRPSAS